MSYQFPRALRAIVLAGLAGALVSACSGANGASTLPNAAPAQSNVRMHPQLPAAHYQFVHSWGAPNGIAYVFCPDGWTVIGGGSNDDSGAAIGNGHIYGNGWIVPTSPGKSEAIASCADSTVAPHYQWIDSVKAGTDGLAKASCPSGWTLVTGYAENADFQWYNDQYEFYMAKGAPDARAHASCTDLSPANGNQIFFGSKTAQSSWPQQMVSPCPDGYTPIAGSFGTKDNPGGADRMFPQFVAPVGWKAYSGQELMTTYAVCVAGNVPFN